MTGGGGQGHAFTWHISHAATQGVLSEHRLKSLRTSTLIILTDAQDF